MLMPKPFAVPAHLLLKGMHLQTHAHDLGFEVDVRLCNPHSNKLLASRRGQLQLFYLCIVCINIGLVHKVSEVGVSLCC